MNNLRAGLLIASLFLLFPFSVPAADSAAVQFSSVNNFNAPNTDSVRGVRLAALYGRSGHVSGVDLPFGFSDLDSLNGISFPLISGANRVRKEMNGIALGVFNWHQGNDAGLNFSTVNVTHNVNGLNLALVNVSTGHTAFDVSAVNVSKKSNFQLAVFNMTDTIDGVQIGLLNCAKNGFLRCFPIINFGTE